MGTAGAAAAAAAAAATRIGDSINGKRMALVIAIGERRKITEGMGLVNLGLAKGEGQQCSCCVLLGGTQC